MILPRASTCNSLANNKILFPVLVVADHDFMYFQVTTFVGGLYAETIKVGSYLVLLTCDQGREAMIVRIIP
ncbi:hypothetical protein CHUAL_013105 [Chamberlinius hualienensis]